MAKGHRSQIKRDRNEQKDTRPSAKISYARVSVQKACFVLDAIRGKDVKTALGILAYNPRYASSIIEKLLKSAIANAENNNGMSTENLYIEECYANKGPTMKRIRQEETRRLHNRYYGKTMRNAVRKLRATTDKTEAVAMYPGITKMLDKLAKTNVIHKNKANNLKSKLALYINKLA